MENNVLLLQRQGCTRVVIPIVLRNQILNLLHEGHWGTTRMKQTARRYVWWPNVNSDVESLVRGCMICRENAKAPVVAFQS